ncbi:MAG TPA: metalloregulator ArsR/SmtB family transcription factor [Saprospiraceae bacterium]|nr:metalloregulator ArsR/SmtB family transcription factor [Saprospiraceae bacterium]
MGVTKTEAFTVAQNELAAICKALGHPARVAIIQHLLKVNSCICGDIVDELPLAQATISRHLKELKTIGIIKGTIEGTSINYCIDAQRWRAIQGLLNGLFDTYVSDQDCTC